MLTWSCFSAETQPSPLEAAEPEREELCSSSKDSPMQVKEPEAEDLLCFQCCSLDLRFSWAAGILVNTSPFTFLCCSVVPIPFGQLHLEPLSPVAGDLLPAAARSSVSPALLFWRTSSVGTAAWCLPRVRSAGLSGAEGPQLLVFGHNFTCYSPLNTGGCWPQTVSKRLSRDSPKGAGLG